MPNKISVSINLRPIKIILQSIILFFLACQFSYADDFFVINKENLSPSEKRIETQTYIDLVWGAYVYRKPAYIYAKDPAATPLPYSPIPLTSKKSVAKATVSSEKTTTAKNSLNPVISADTKVVVQTPKTEKVDVKSEVKTEVKAESLSKSEQTVKTKPTELDTQVQSSSSNVLATKTKPTNPTVEPTISMPTVTATSPTPNSAPSVRQQPIPIEQIPEQRAEQGANDITGMINVLDGDSRPPYESFVSDLGELKDM